MFLHFNMACNKSIIGTCESMWCSVVHQSLRFNLFSLPIQAFPSSLFMAKGRAVISSPNSKILSIADLLVGTSIKTTKLWGKNYLQQSAAVKTFLSSNEKLKYIEEEPADAISSKWIKEDAEVRLWPWNFVEPHINSNVMLLMFDNQFESYATEKNIQRIYGLRDDCRSIPLKAWYKISEWILSALSNRNWHQEKSKRRP